MAQRKRFIIRVVSTFPPRICGIGTFSRDLTAALMHFPHDIRSVRVAAIDKDGLSYSRPVDMVIRQYDPASWRQAAEEIVQTARHSQRRKVVLLQHEYGLDPDADGRDCRGRNFVEMARRFHEAGILVIAYLHTVLSQPDEHQRAVLQDLAGNCDRMVVTTQSAVEILRSDLYGIPPAKVQHIDHGIRPHSPSDADRLAMKRIFGLQGIFLTTTVGLRSPDKGVQYSIPAYAAFVKESLTAEQRRRMLYLIAGQCHPEFMRAEGGRLYREYQAMLDQALAESGLAWCRTENLRQVDLRKHDLVILDRFLDEQLLLRLYAATNVMLLPYLNMEQISSGILADTVGSGRVAIATKFRYALELLGLQHKVRPGLMIDRGARGILVDPGPPSVEQMAQALDYVVFNESARLRMEHRARARGHEMRWDNTAWQILCTVQLLFEQRGLKEGRGYKFRRLKPSRFAEANRRLFAMPVRDEAQPTPVAPSAEAGLGVRLE